MYSFPSAPLKRLNYPDNRIDYFEYSSLRVEPVNPHVSVLFYKSTSKLLYGWTINSFKFNTPKHISSLE